MSYPGEPPAPPVQSVDPDQFLRMLRQYHPDAAPAPAPADLTPDERRDALDLFVAGKACSHCGGLHPRACPRVKRMVMDSQGRLVEVEFWPWGEWPTDVVVWPEDVTEPQDTEA